MSSKYTFKDLLDIMEKLRGEDGCPWDREQTHESIKRSIMEEGYELIEAIDEKSPEKIFLSAVGGGGLPPHMPLQLRIGIQPFQSAPQPERFGDNHAD